MSKVALEGMQFYAYHGFYEEERLIGGHFVVDVYVETNFVIAAQSDDLSGTVNYETIYFICRMEMKRPSNLIEHVAQRIHDKLSAVLTKSSAILVRISKLNPPLGGPVSRSFVEVGQMGNSQSERGRYHLREEDYYLGEEDFDEEDEEDYGGLLGNLEDFNEW